MRQEGGQSRARLRDGAHAERDATRCRSSQKILAFYARRFGPCPYPSIGLVLAEGETPGGHSPPGLVYLQQRPPVLRARSLPDDPANFSDLPGFFVAHEVAHQWWGQGDGARELPRAVAVGGVGAVRGRALGAREPGRGRLPRDDGPHGAAGRSSTTTRARSTSASGSGTSRRDPRIFRAVVYDKGAWVLHMLRGILGDEAFFAGARAFLEGHRFAKAGTEDLREALEKASGRDLRPYFERWIYDTGLPRAALTRHTQPRRRRLPHAVDVRPSRLPGRCRSRSRSCGAPARDAARRLGPDGGSFTFETRARPRRVLAERGPRAARAGRARAAAAQR